MTMYRARVNVELNLPTHLTQDTGIPNPTVTPVLTNIDQSQNA
jgi:hypothetical protein